MTKRMARCSGAALLAGAVASSMLAREAEAACNPPSTEDRRLTEFKVTHVPSGRSVTATPTDNPKTLVICEGEDLKIQISGTVVGGTTPNRVGWRIEKEHGYVHNLVDVYVPAPTPALPAVSRNQGNLGIVGCNPEVDLYPKDTDPSFRIFHIKAFCDDIGNCSLDDGDAYYEGGVPVTIIEIDVVVLKVDIESFLAEPGSEPGRPDLIVLGYDKGRVKYQIQPTGFTADTAELEIKNKNGVVVFKTDLTGKSGGVSYTYDWEGKWNQSPNESPARYANPYNGPYTGQIKITKGMSACTSNNKDIWIIGKAIIESATWFNHANAVEGKLYASGFDDRYVEAPPDKANAIAKVPCRLVFYFMGHGGHTGGTPDEFVGPIMKDAPSLPDPSDASKTLRPTDLPADLHYEVVFMNGCYSWLDPNRSDFISRFGSRVYIGWDGDPYIWQSDTAGWTFFYELADGNTAYNAYLAAAPAAPAPWLRLSGDGSQILKME